MVNSVKGQLGFTSLNTIKRNTINQNKLRTNVSFGSQNPFMTDTFELSTKTAPAKAVTSKPQSFTFSGLVSFLGSKVDTAVLKAQILSTGEYKEEDADKILSCVTPDNKEFVGFITDKNQTGRTIYSFAVQEILKAINSENSSIVKDLFKAQFESGKGLNDNGLKAVLKDTTSENIEVLKALINPENNTFDSRLLFSSDITALLKPATAENAQVIVDLIKEQDEKGQPKYNRSSLSMLAKNAKGSDSEVLQVLESAKNSDGRARFSDENIRSIVQCERENKSELLPRLIEVSALSGNQIDTALRFFKQPALDYLFANKDDQYRRDVLFALNPYFDEAPTVKIIESANVDNFSDVEKQQLAKLLCKKEYKNICKQLQDYNIPLLPKMNERTARVADLLGQLRQNHTLPRLSDHDMWVFNSNIDEMNNGNDIEGNIHNLNVLFSTDFRSAIQPLKALVADPNFQNLNDGDKKVVKLAVLLQNRADNAMDASHEAKAFLSQSDLSGKEIYKVAKLVANQDWLNDFLGANMSVNQLATTYFMKPGMYELTKLMTAANFKAQGREGSLLNIETASRTLDPVVDQITSNAINLPETRIPKASELHLPYEQLGEGAKTNNKVIRLTDNPNLEELGFAQGTNRDNLYMLVHAINEHIDKLQLEELQVPTATFDVRDTINYVNYTDKTGDGLFSASLISSDNNNLFINQRYAFVFDTDEDNVALASQKDIWSGYDKAEDVFTSHVMRHDRGSYADNIKEELQKQYGDESAARHIYRDIAGFQALTDLNPQTAHSVKQAIDKNLMNPGEHNEIIVRAPKVQAVLVKNASLDKMPFELRQFAERYDLPIIAINPK